MVRFPDFMTQVYGKIFQSGNLSQSHMKVIHIVGGRKKVLELGSSTGYITKRLADKSCIVDIVEIDKDDAKVAAKHARKMFLGSVEDKKLLEAIKEKYDFILACDILEHLADPGKVLQIMRKNLKKGGRVIISLPNIACWEARRDLFFHGDFNYKESGILDKTHLRFFTFYTIQDLIESCGYRIQNIFVTEYSYPLRNFILSFRPVGVYADKLICSVLRKLCPNFCAMHSLFEIFDEDG